MISFGGRQLVAAVAKRVGMKWMDYLHDDTRLRGQKLNSIRFFSIDQLKALKMRGYVSVVLMALSSATRTRCNETFERFRKYIVRVCTLEGLLIKIYAGPIN